nr:GtrA family protein [Enorma massiliensis]
MKFAAVGIFSFVVDWLLLVILTEGFGIDYLVSTTVSFLVSVSLNYALSMKYVFEHRDDMSRKREFTIFAILSCIGLGLTDVLMFAGVTILNIAYQAMKVIATFCVTWYNFFTRKKFLSATN